MSQKTKLKPNISRNGVFVAVSLIVVALLIPTESLVVSAWAAQVVNTNGKPVEGIYVRQSWQNYSVESLGHEETIVTGKDGKVSFPERRVSASTLMRILGPVGNLLSTGVHASYGPSSMIIVFGKDNLEGSGYYNPGKPLPTQIIVKRRE